MKHAPVKSRISLSDTHITLLLPAGEPGDSWLEIPLSPVEVVPGEEPWEGQSPGNSNFTPESGLSRSAMLLLSLALFLAALFRRDRRQFCICTGGKNDRRNSLHREKAVLSLLRKAFFFFTKSVSEGSAQWAVWSPLTRVLWG